ncbi:unnamed protein product [Diplocarpon coronariae]
MSVKLPSSNPFRKRTPAALPSAISERSSMNPHSPQNTDTQADYDSIAKSDVTKNFIKKVRVQSPPPPSPSTPSLPDSSSTISDEAYNMPERPPTPPMSRKDDPFNSVPSDTSEEEEDDRLGKAPANPFSKTLESMECPERRSAIIPSTDTPIAGRASMDVDAFKRLLMTGNSGLGIPTTQSAAHAQVVHTLGDGSSSTGISSNSRQSFFKAIHEPSPESPRTSHEISEPENDQRLLVAEALPSASRKKPPPPSSRHGKLIKVELKDENTPTGLQSPPTPCSIASQHYLNSSPRSQTDLNKPLPLAPNRAIHDSDHESVFDKESAGKTPELASLQQTARVKAPPAPPLTRRHSQKIAGTTLSRGGSIRLSPEPVEQSTRLLDMGNENRKTPSSEDIKTPPLPPPRRSGSVRSLSYNPLKSPSTVSLPAPPPARGSRSTSGGKPSSLINIDASPANKRSSVIAPPPPPPRHGHRSTSGIEAKSPGTSRRPSGEHTGHSTKPRRGSLTPSLLHDEPAQTKDENYQIDILADLGKLQRDIDALRIQSEDRRIA